MIVSTSELIRYRHEVAMVDGGFDPLHAGHIEYFREAADLGAPVLCNVSSDRYVAAKHPPLLPQGDRGRLIDAIRYIAYTHLSQTSTAEVLQRLQPRYYVKGADWREGLPAEEAAICAEAGTEVVFLDTIVHSSTAILDDYMSSEYVWNPALQAESAPGTHPDTAARALTPTRIDSVVTHHLNTFASGVARFNEILAERLGVSLVGLMDPALGDICRPLLSFKVGELDYEEERLVEDLIRRPELSAEVYLHDWGDLPLERLMVDRTARVWCGNLEVEEQLRDRRSDLQLAWAPGLLLDQRTFQPAELSVFSFGMAHKLRTDMFARLRDLLEAAGQSYRLYVSSANHETASIGEAQLVYEEMTELFPRGLYFMGNLSDVAVFNYLQGTTFFAAFFPKGVRSNNTSVAAAMEQGCVVITNLDEHSPPHLRHLHNVLDIAQCDELPSDSLLLKELGVNAMRAARAHSWERLVALLNAQPNAAVGSSERQRGVDGSSAGA